eukprot:COSAG01_NODE_2642_length_7323_cov_13.197121_8_plen_416_part_00
MTQKIKLLLIICGGIAAYKVLDFIRDLKKQLESKQQEIAFDVMLTTGAEKFITPLSVAALSGGEVHTNQDFYDPKKHLLHLDASRRNDAILVFAATANFMAKVANGLCDELASTLIAGSEKPAIFAPAMNPQMWQAPALQRNLKQLKADGHKVIMPVTGKTLCEEEGIGRLAENGQIQDFLLAYLEQLAASSPVGNSQAQVLKGKQVLITSGATWEAIDPVRGISNPASGKQGLALYHVFKAAGATLHVVAGWRHVGVDEIDGVVSVKSADDMYAAVMRILEKENIDIMIAAAAVSDWKVAQIETHKAKKSTQACRLELLPTVDILKTVGHSKQRPKTLIGFAAETQDIEAYAKEKCKAKNLDLIVANQVGESQGFNQDENSVTLIDRKGNSQDLNKQSKTAIAEHLLKWVLGKD